METPPSQATASAAKLRLMCSYGGYILPRPRTNSLCYAGGETRIVSIERRAVTTLSSLISHLSSTLSINFPFTLKYQLPHLDLDSLISLASDEDLHILIDEHNRLASSSPSPSRIRLFVFPESGRPVIRHPKTESWFFDALKSAKIMQNGAEEGEPNHFVSSAPESIVLETSSSFGSTSSSSSFTNLPPVRAHFEDKFTSSDTIPSDNTVSSVMSPQQNISYQEPVVHVSEARVNAESIEVESKIPYISSGFIANNTNVDIGYTSCPQFNQVERPHLQFVQAATHFLPLHPSGLLPVPSLQHIYQQPRPLQHMVYHANQPCPVYLVPIGNMPPNSLPISAASQASLNLNASLMNCHVAHNPEVGARSPFAHDFTSQNYLTNNAIASVVHVPYNGSQQKEMDIYQMHNQSQSQNVSITPRESPEYENELDDDLARVQIYKSQPPPPTLPSKYKTMAKATTDPMSEALAQLHVDNHKQQTETLQPQ
ncbi:protein PAL OF QUIRKY [Gastrolobium bilobum]|uniref:protein PAL OF QUIRKY n=1 Tax=Gastrolobium bilobum TaxID=150636 RepID=UPI002AB32067|nr:protein PAL OF QUIRKY [Gastrolobium bilobum]